MHRGDALFASVSLGAAGEKEVPAGMVRMPNGAFAIDATLVTRAAFAQFVAATGYVTTAERVGFGMGVREGMDDWEWECMPRATWRKPFREGTPETEGFLADDAPVVLVSWHDAAAFCAHQGKRLPTEAEWEYAMRAGSRGTRFPWGNTPERHGKLGLNFWQGTYDPVGNVWQWTADWYTAGSTRVLRGGSWWCGACTCEGYGLFSRGKARPDAAYNNNGFRCAMDLR